MYSNDQVQISINDQQASISEQEHPALNCRNNRGDAIWEHAKLNGADFRAVGNEPGWHLEIISATSMVLVTDYGDKTIEQPLPIEESDPDTRITRWAGEHFELLVSGTPCTNSMSGEHFEASVSVTLGDRVLNGCGRALH